MDTIPNKVKEAFLDIALSLKGAGYDRYSSDAILHRLRWHFQIEKGDRSFKCNNYWTAPLARWAMATAPELDGFFETRKRVFA
jgi:hypothetical protein